MQRDIVLAVNMDGEAVRVFDPGEKYLAARLAGVIAREAQRNGLSLSVVVVPIHDATPEDIAAFLKECWEEDRFAEGDLSEPPTSLFPANAYDR